jgi:hypothetical protein
VAIKEMALNDLTKLGVDQNNRLYWNKEPVATGSRVTLQPIVNRAIFIGGFSTFGLFLIGLGGFAFGAQ